MTRPQVRQAVAAFALTSVLSLIPWGTANAAVRSRSDRTEHHVSSWIASRGAWLRGTLIHLCEKARVLIDPEGLTVPADPDGHG